MKAKGIEQYFCRSLFPDKIGLFRIVYGSYAYGGLFIEIDRRSDGQRRLRENRVILLMEVGGCDGRWS